MNRDFLGSALHIVRGASAGGTMRQVLRPYRGRLLIGEDDLASGPTPATNDFDIWQGVREWFVNRIRQVQGMEFSFDAYEDSGLFMNAASLRDEDEIVAWAGIGLADQLNLAWTAHLCDRHGVDLAKLRVIQFERNKSWTVGSMGELNPEFVSDHFPAPRAPTAAEADELRRAWHVYTSSDPADLVAYAAGPTVMPFLHAALRALVLRYPDRRSGLGVIEETLLRNVKKQGPKPIRIVGETIARNDGADREGHDYLFWRLLQMGKLKTPLVAVGGRPAADFGMEFLKRANAPKMLGEAEIRLTPFGEAVLAGEANTVRENGIDLWIGGVHLTDAENPPFREGWTLLLRAPQS
jgi:hypothetical protein